MDIPQLSLHSRIEAAKEQKDRSQEATNGTPGDIRAGWELGTGTKVVGLEAPRHLGISFHDLSESPNVSKI